VTAPRLLVDGRDTDAIAALDRGVQYGDGLFETIAVTSGRPRLLEGHLGRLRLGCRRLGIEPFDDRLLASEIEAVTAGCAEAVVKLIVTRGPAGRGYRPPETVRATRVVAAFEGAPGTATRPLPPLRVRTCSTRLGRNPALAGMKHLCRLEQVLARSEWRDERIGEGLMQDDCGRVVCATQSNLFVVISGRLLTPRVDEAGVAGVMRAAVLAWAGAEGLDCAEERIEARRLAEADAMFLTNAIGGARPVIELDGRTVPQDDLPARFMQWLCRG